MEIWNLQELYAAKAQYEASISSEDNQAKIENIQQKIDDIDAEIQLLKTANQGVIPSTSAPQFKITTISNN